MSHSTAILICGMHRSGTSAAARAVNLLGAPLGSRLMPPAADNARGFWEQADIVPAHEALLLALPRGWDSIAPLPRGWERTPEARACAATLRGVINEEFAGAPLWAIKDPRLCLLLPLWKPLLQERGVTAKALLVFRHPLEAAGSLMKRDRMGREEALLLWLHYTLAAERDSRGIPRAALEYGALLEDWKTALHRTGRQLGLDWPEWSRAEAEIGAFLSGELRHHRAGNPEPETPAEAWACEIYRALQRTMESGEWDGEVFDRATERYTALLAPLLPALEGYERRVAEERRRTDALARALAGSEHARSDLAAQQEAQRRLLEDERARHARNVAQLQREIERIHASASWKVTQPLRSARALLGGKESA